MSDDLANAGGFVEVAVFAFIGSALIAVMVSPADATVPFAGGVFSLLIALRARRQHTEASS